MPVSKGNLFCSFRITIGSLLGFILSVIFERKSGKIYEKDFIEDIFETSIIADINTNTADQNSRNKYINSFFKKEIKNINFIKIGIEDNSYNETIVDSTIEKIKELNLFKERN